MTSYARYNQNSAIKLACCFLYTEFTASGCLSEYKTSKEFQVCNSFKFTLFNLQGTMFAARLSA